jgi:hypothetical protein
MPNVLEVEKQPVSLAFNECTPAVHRHRHSVIQCDPRTEVKMAQAKTFDACV